MRITKMLLTNRGDTIIEVLIAITVVSFVLGGAYVTSNRNLNNMRQAQERGEALKYVQEQVERLKANASTEPTLFSINEVFCLDGSASPVHAARNDHATVGNFGATHPLNSDNLSVYTAICKTSSNVPYYLAIERIQDPNLSDNHHWIFTVHARWESATGSGNDEVTQAYKADN